MEPVFVASPTEVWRGDEARERITETNDLQFAVDDNILQVSPERWQQAQHYERVTWMNVNPHYVSDRNETHAAAFDGYKPLPSMVGSLLEIGCGPFTNTRLILQRMAVAHITLLDPLIEDYLHHPHCTYADGTLNGVAVETVASSIETYKTRKKFDVVVMINVLPHCYDAERIFERVPKLIKKGGWIAWAEMPIMPEEALDDVYDVGHPIKVRPDRMEAFLSQFKQVYRNGWYFIGQSE
jgi:SAM-dependent methyltransferase